MTLDYVYSGSLFTNSNWFAFEDERTADENPSGSIASSSPETKGNEDVGGARDEVILEEDENLADTATSGPPEQDPTLDDNAPSKLSEGFRETETSGTDKSPEWVEWRESSDAIESPPTSNSAQNPPLPNGELEEELVGQPDIGPDKTLASPISADTDSGVSPDSKEIDSGIVTSKSTSVADDDRSIEKVDSHAGTEDSSEPTECEKKN